MRLQKARTLTIARGTKGSRSAHPEAREMREKRTGRLTFEERARRILMPALGLQLRFDTRDFALELDDTRLQLGDGKCLETFADGHTEFRLGSDLIPVHPPLQSHVQPCPPDCAPSRRSAQDTARACLRPRSRASVPA